MTLPRPSQGLRKQASSCMDIRGMPLALFLSNKEEEETEMQTRGLIPLTLSGSLALALAACQQKTSETAKSMATTPAAGAAATETTATTPVAKGAPVTADPVIASQHNATRRRRSWQAPLDSSSRREGSTAYSEERQGAPSAATAREHEVPSGTILRVAFDQTLSTATAKVGDRVPGQLLDNLIAEDGTVVARSESRVVGKVEHVVSSGRLARPAELKFRLIELEPPGGKPVPVSTSTYDRKGETHTKHDVEYIAGGAAVGALLGQIIGRDTESTLKGAAAGSAAGTGVAAATGQLDFEIQAGRTVAFTLEQPLRLPAAR